MLAAVCVAPVSRPAQNSIQGTHHFCQLPAKQAGGMFAAKTSAAKGNVGRNVTFGLHIELSRMGLKYNLTGWVAFWQHLDVLF